MSKILYENGPYWVTPAKRGFEVYKSGVTSSTRCAIIGFEGDKGLRRAIQEADRRAASFPLCTCGGEVGQPPSHHDISCPSALSPEERAEVIATGHLEP